MKVSSTTVLVDITKTSSQKPSTRVIVYHQRKVNDEVTDQTRKLAIEEDEL